MRHALLLCLVGCQADPVHQSDTDSDVLSIDSDTVTDAPADTDVVSVERVTLQVGEQVVCLQPDQRQAAPYSDAITGGAWAEQSPTGRSRYTGGGITAVDVDGDHDIDLIRPGLLALQLWLQEGAGVFVEASDHLPEVLDNNDVVTAADVDGDGDLDLYVGREGTGDRLWINDGSGRFTDGTAAAGLEQSTPVRSTSVSFADFDRDGDLDLYVGAFGDFRGNPRPPADPKTLWRNRGDGTFEDASQLIPESIHTGYTFVAGWWDTDRDGYPDLYSVNDFGQHFPNVLLRNQGGAFQVQENTGLDVTVNGMGLGIGDINGDGIDDVVCAGWTAQRLMVSSGGSWFEAHQTLGFSSNRAKRQVIGWAAELADLDNDGDLDIAQGYGDIYDQDSPDRQADEIYRNDEGTFTAVGNSWGFADTGATRGILAVDVNGDGWLDLLRGDVNGPATLQLAQCGEAAWISVEVRDDATPNRFGVGVELTATAGAQSWRRTILAGGRSVMSSGPPLASFGFGNVDVLDALTVRWTDGGESVFLDVPTRRALTVHRAP